MTARLVLLGLAAALLPAGVLVWHARRRWEAATTALQEQVAAGAWPARVHSERELEGLPPPVARYLRATLRAGRPIPSRVRVAWSGEFNMGGPGADRWVPFTAVQDFALGTPGFVWDARMKMMPGVMVYVRDALVGDGASMLGKVLGLVTVVDKRGGSAFAQAALQRYLGEAIWFPHALLPSQGVHWEPIDAHKARATIRAGGTSTALEFQFGADGLVESSFAAQRTFDDGRHPPSQHPWRARVLRYTHIDGIAVPAEAVVEWLLPGGIYAYWRGRPTDIRYEYPAGTEPSAAAQGPCSTVPGRTAEVLREGNRFEGESA